MYIYTCNVCNVSASTYHSRPFTTALFAFYCRQTFTDVPTYICTYETANLNKQLPERTTRTCAVLKQNNYIFE